MTDKKQPLWRHPHEDLAVLDVLNRHGVRAATIIRSDWTDNGRRWASVSMGDPYIPDLWVDLEPHFAENIKTWFKGLQTMAVWHPQTPRSQDVAWCGGVFGHVSPVPADLLDAVLPSLVALVRQGFGRWPTKEQERRDERKRKAAS